MAFFTLFCKKTHNLILSKLSILFVLFFASSMAFAATSNIQIKSADLQLNDDFYALSADIDINFDETIEEAINKGVPLTFLIEFQIVSPRKYWFDDEIVTATTNVVLSYHALSRQYLVNRGKHQKSFETLSEAKQELAQLIDWKVLDKAMIDKNDVYNAALLIRLDQTKLPKAIQVDTISTEKWNVSSPKYEWPLKELFAKDMK
jgi:Domain of unknown function (DUF4390)